MSLALPDATFVAGIDWAAAEHAVCVLDESGKVAASFTVRHDADGLRRLISRLAAFGDPGSIPVGIERPSGRLVDVLLEAGHPVVPVKPNAIKAWRESEVLSGAKSDAGDAAVIAEYVRLRHHRLRVAAPYSGQTRALRTVVRTREDLVEMRVAATNQLAALLETWWPGARCLFADIESPIALEFLTRYPTPASAARLGEGRMAAFCARHHYSGRRSAAELLTRLRTAAPGTLDETLTPALRDSVLALVTVLKTLNAAVKGVTRSVSDRLAEHPDGKIFTSLPRSGQVSAASMLAEWGDCRDAYEGPDSIAALAGMCPVTKASGKHRVVGFRWACNKRFRRAMTTFADNSRHASPWAARVYADAIGRGCDHPHAVRVLGRAWIRVIYRCWLDDIPYDPAAHSAARMLVRQPDEQQAA